LAVFLSHLLEQEVATRQQRRIDRLRTAGIPPN